MAFNLNKNEATGSSTKFDLSKNDASAGIGTAPEKTTSKTWLFALVAFLVIGITAWYFLSGPNDISKNENDVVSAATDPNPANTPPGNPNTATAAPVNTTGDAQTENKSSSTAPAKKAETDAKAATGNTSNSPATAVSATSINNKVPATFAKGSNSISGLDGSLVKDIIAFLKKNPGSIITVNGYASSEGALAVNRQISQSRADAFKRYLVSKGIPNNSINATGKGIDNPIGSNDTEEGRIKNRRVEISLQ